MAAYYREQECIDLSKTLKICKKDTGLDVGTNNVPRHIKINADEFTLKEKKKCFYLSFNIKQVILTIDSGGNKHDVLYNVISYKSRRVVVLDSLSVAEGLQYGVGLQQLSLQLALRHTADITSDSQHGKTKQLQQKTSIGPIH